MYMYLQLHIGIQYKIFIILELKRFILRQWLSISILHVPYVSDSQPGEFLEFLMLLIEQT